jgi:hypothetical protein
MTAEEQRARETAAAFASPLDPNVEYIPASMANRAGCHCPRTVLNDGPRSWQLKVLHLPGCDARVSEASPVSERRPAGVHECPDCRNVTWMLVPGAAPGMRRCHGPQGCGRDFNPTPDAVQPRQSMAQRLATQRAA